MCYGKYGNSRNKFHSVYGQWLNKEVSLFYLYSLCLNYWEQKTTDLPEISIICLKLSVRELEIKMIDEKL